MVSILLSCQTQIGLSGLSIENLTCEHQSNPLGIDRLNPQLSWMIKSGQRGQKQTVYHILVASSEEKLKNNTGDLWDSGKVSSGQSVYVSYDGKALQSADQCFWKVMIWDKDQEPSKWSQPAFWSMGLLQPDDWEARWISTPEENTAPFFRREGKFSVNKLKSGSYFFTSNISPNQAIIAIDTDTPANAEPSDEGMDEYLSHMR